MNQKIRNLDELLAEKAKLKSLCKEKELLIGKKLDYIHDNLGIIALETILPVKNSSKNTFSNVFDGVINLVGILIPSLAEKLNKSDKIIKIIELVASSLFTSFFNKKSE